MGYTGLDIGTYARRHNTIALCSDAVNDSVAVKNLVQFTQFATDLASNAPSNYSMIVPNLCNDAHDCNRCGDRVVWIDWHLEQREVTLPVPARSPQ